MWKVAVVNLKIKYLQIYINFWLKMSSDQVIPKLFSNILRAASLTHFMLLLSFYTSWKHQKIIDFHKVKKVTWHKMGYRQIECLAINTPRRSLQQVYFKIDVLKNLSNFKTVLESLFNKVAGWHATLLKRDCSTGVSLWNLQYFSEYLFLQNTSDRCFWNTFFWWRRNLYKTLQKWFWQGYWK